MVHAMRRSRSSHFMHPHSGPRSGPLSNWVRGCSAALWAGLACAFAASCAELPESEQSPPDRSADAGADAGGVCLPSWTVLEPVVPVAANPPNPRAEELVLYELQVRSANACDPLVGSEAQRAACRQRPAPEVEYRAQDSTCASVGQLERIRLGTLDDLLEPTTDFRQGITLAYIDERVAANALWLMPIFPNNDVERLPSPCDNIGSPYAARDYFHAAGTLSRQCIADERDEYSDDPCWANDEMAQVIDAAHARDMLVLLDVAFNHFGHQYLFYDAATFNEAGLAGAPAGVDPYDFDATFDEALLWPEPLDSVAELDALRVSDPLLAQAADAVESECPSLQGQELVRAVAMWRVATEAERSTFDCEHLTLEEQLPGFYLGASTRAPSTEDGDNFSRDWYDVKFLYHRLDLPAQRATALRNREYLFRVLNYWVSLGVDGFRLDHATNDLSGISAETWRYLIAKVNYYAALRGQPQPVFMAEEFHNQAPMAPVVDAMIEGYLFDINGRYAAAKDTSYVQRILDNANRFDFQTLVNAHLENHDELRLTDGTGFDPWVGLGFWSLGASNWSLPMLLVGQEFGDSQRLQFRRSSYLPGRFEGTPQYRQDADGLIDAYATLNRARLAPDNSALRSAGRQFLRSATGALAVDVVAYMKWSTNGAPFMVINNLWTGDRRFDVVVPATTMQAAGLDSCEWYEAVDVLTGQVVVPCQAATSWTRRINLWIPWSRRVMWARVQACEPTR